MNPPSVVVLCTTYAGHHAPARFEVRWQDHVAAHIRQRFTWRGWRWTVQIVGALPRDLLLAQLALFAVVEARRDGA